MKPFLIGSLTLLTLASGGSCVKLEPGNTRLR